MAGFSLVMVVAVLAALFTPARFWLGLIVFIVALPIALFFGGVAFIFLRAFVVGVFGSG